MRTFQHVPIDQRLDLLKVMAHATPLMQAVMFLMIAAALACLAVWARQAIAARQPGPARADSALAFLGGVLVAAPLFAFASAAYEMLHMSLGIANLRPIPDLIDLAPGFAEMSLLVFLGFVASGVAAAARAHLKLKTL